MWLTAQDELSFVLPYLGAKGCDLFKKHVTGTKNLQHSLCRAFYNSI